MDEGEENGIIAVGNHPSDISNDPDTSEDEKLYSKKNQRRSCQSKHSRRKEVGLFIYAVVSVALTSGLVFGWPALRRHLIVIEDKSHWDERTLGIIFICGGWSNQGVRLFYGLLRDYTWLGTKWTTCLALFMCMTGLIGLAVANTPVGMSIAMFLVGTGSGVQLTLQPVANLFPNYQGALLSTLGGAFQLSGLVFLVLFAFSESRKLAVLLFSGIISCLIIIGSLILPPRTFVRENEENLEEDDEEELSLEDSVAKSASQREKTSDTEDDNTGEKTPPTSLWIQLKSLEYLLLVSWLSILLSPLQFYIASIGFQLELRGDTEGKYTNMFAVIFSASALASPVIGYVSDKLGLGVAQGIAQTLVAASFFLLAFSRSIPLCFQPIGLVCYGVGRLSIFCMFFTNIGIRFGYENYGTLTGIGLLVSAVVSLLQYPMIEFSARGTTSSSEIRIHSDTVVDAACGCICFLLLPYCIWLGFRERREKV